MKDFSKISGFYTNQENLKRIDYFPNYTKRKKMVKPPFKRGLYSYKQSNGYIKNLNNKNAFSYESPNYSGFNIKKDKNQILNIYPVEGNSSLSISFFVPKFLFIAFLSRTRKYNSIATIINTAFDNKINILLLKHPFSAILNI